MFAINAKYINVIRTFAGKEGSANPHQYVFFSSYENKVRLFATNGASALFLCVPNVIFVAEADVDVLAQELPPSTWRHVPLDGLSLIKAKGTVSFEFPNAATGEAIDGGRVQVAYDGAYGTQAWNTLCNSNGGEYMLQGISNMKCSIETAQDDEPEFMDFDAAELMKFQKAAKALYGNDQRWRIGGAANSHIAAVEFNDEVYDRQADKMTHADVSAVGVVSANTFKHHTAIRAFWPSPLEWLCDNGRYDNDEG